MSLLDNAEDLEPGELAQVKERTAPRRGYNIPHDEPVIQAKNPSWTEAVGSNAKARNDHLAGARDLPLDAWVARRRATRDQRPPLPADKSAHGVGTPRG